MPRQYEDIKQSELKSGKSLKVAKRIAAATYNKQHHEQPNIGSAPNGNEPTSNIGTGQEISGEEAQGRSPQEKEKSTGKEEAQTINPNPTEAQKEAGNYKKAHIRRDGFEISVENAKGSIRSKTNEKTGKSWSVKMNNDYGYLRGTVGKDKDHLDAFLADDYKENQPVYIVNQTTPDGKFDEHKVMMGFDNKEDALDAYKSNYNKGAIHYSDIVEMPMDEFKVWSKDQSQASKPAKENNIIKQINDDYNGRFIVEKQKNGKGYRIEDQERVWNDGVVKAGNSEDYTYIKKQIDDYIRKANAKEKPQEEKLQEEKPTSLSNYTQVSSDYYIHINRPAKGQSEFQKVNAKKVILPSVPNGDFFLHKDVNEGKAWIISEGITGASIADGKTQTEATEKADKLIRDNNGAVGLSNVINKMIQQNGITPRYALSKETPKEEKPSEDKFKNAAIDLIKYYVERGDSFQSIKQSATGSAVEGAFARIIKDKIEVTINDEVKTFPLKSIFDEIKSSSQQGEKKPVITQLENDDMFQLLQKDAYDAESFDDWFSYLTEGDKEFLVSVGKVRKKGSNYNIGDLEYFYNRNKNPEAPEEKPSQQKEADSKSKQFLENWEKLPQDRKSRR